MKLQYFLPPYFSGIKVGKEITHDCVMPWEKIMHDKIIHDFVRLTLSVRLNGPLRMWGGGGGTYKFNHSLADT